MRTVSRLLACWLTSPRPLSGLGTGGYIVDPYTASAAVAHAKFGHHRHGAFGLSSIVGTESAAPPLEPTAAALASRATRRMAHVAFPRLGRALRTKNIYHWARKDLLPVTIIDNQKCVSRQFVNHLLSDWRHSVIPTQATRLLGITEGQVYGLIRQPIQSILATTGREVGRNPNAFDDMR
jgi:hypothetical protein